MFASFGTVDTRFLRLLGRTHLASQWACLSPVPTCTVDRRVEFTGLCVGRTRQSAGLLRRQRLVFCPCDDHEQVLQCLETTWPSVV